MTYYHDATNKGPPIDFGAEWTGWKQGEWTGWKQGEWTGWKQGEWTGWEQGGWTGWEQGVGLSNILDRERREDVSGSGPMKRTHGTGVA